jgi:hypothetical protein
MRTNLVVVTGSNEMANGGCGLNTKQALYLPPRYWAGRHDLKTGIEFNHINFDERALTFRIVGSRVRGCW